MTQRKNRTLKGARRITTAGILTSLSLLCLYLAGSLPTSRLTFYVLSSVFVAGLLLEGENTLAWLMYIAVSLLGLGVIGNKLRVIPYILFFGNYGIIKYYIEKLDRRALETIIKLVYFNLTIIAMTAAVQQLFLSELTIKLPLGAVMLAAQLFFLLYDYVFTLIIGYYNAHIRRFLI